MSRAHHKGTIAIWSWPLILGTLTSIGLVLALFNDGGVGDLLADLSLALPVVIGLWFGCLREALAAGKPR